MIIITYSLPILQFKEFKYFISYDTLHNSLLYSSYTIVILAPWLFLVRGKHGCWTIKVDRWYTIYLATSNVLNEILRSLKQNSTAWILPRTRNWWWEENLLKEVENTVSIVPMKEMFKTYMYNKIVNSKVNKNFPSHYRYTFKNVKTIFGLKFPFSIFALSSCLRVLVECNILVTFFSVFSPNYSLCLVTKW